MHDDRTRPPLRDDGRAEVVIAGGGVAALEAMIALHDLAPNRVHVTLVAPGPDFVYRPSKIGESFGLGQRMRHPLARAAGEFGASYAADSVESVDGAAREVRCAGGRVLPYESLVVALGARAVPVAGGGGEGAAAPRALWWPPTKIAARRLAPYLFGVDEAGRMRSAGVTELSIG